MIDRQGPRNGLWAMRTFLPHGTTRSTARTDAELAAYYYRLAGETSGMIRRITLRLAEEAQARHRRHMNRIETLELHLVAETDTPVLDGVRRYR